MQKLPEGLRLTQEPTAAIASSAAAISTWRGQNVAQLNSALKEHAHWSSYELRSTASPGAARLVEWRLMAGGGKFTTVGYANGELFVDRTGSGVTGFSQDFPARTAAPVALGAAPLELTILVDRSSVEVFAQGGKVAMTNLVYPPAGAQGMEFSASGANAGQIGVDVWELQSAWR